jgi:hypothetical protein
MKTSSNVQGIITPQLKEVTMVQQLVVEALSMETKKTTPPRVPKAPEILDSFSSN